jgi:hypothetical protein
MRRGLGVMAARVLAYHAAPAPCLARAGARARHGHAPRPADLAAWVPRHAGISRRRNSMLALCPEALKEEEASASYTAPTPTPTPYVPQSEDYAGAGGVVPPTHHAPHGRDVHDIPVVLRVEKSGYAAAEQQRRGRQRPVQRRARHPRRPRTGTDAPSGVLRRKGQNFQARDVHR